MAQDKRTATEPGRQAFSYTQLDETSCGAKTRKGKACRNAPVYGKKRCRMHGGAKGSGAPKGNQNALKHGRYTAERIARDKLLRDEIRLLEQPLKEYRKLMGVLR